MRTEAGLARAKLGLELLACDRQAKSYLPQTQTSLFSLSTLLSDTSQSIRINTFALASPAATSSIGDALQSLPPELFNEIYNLTFTADQNGIVDIEKGNPFPRLLHVDRHSRESYAKSYYSTTRFTFKPCGNPNMRVLVRWYRRLPTLHSAWSGEVVAKIDELKPGKLNWSHHATSQKQCAYANLASFGFHIKWSRELAPLAKTFEFSSGRGVRKASEQRRNRFGRRDSV